MFSSSGCKGQAVALFDVGAASIGVGLAAHTAEGLQMVWHKRLEYAYQAVPDYNRYERAMYATLLEAGMALTTEGLNVAKRNPSFDVRRLSVMCVFGPPWFFGTVHRTVQRKDKPFEVDHALLDAGRSEQYSAFVHEPECRSWQEVMGAHELLESYETAILLDGYRVTQYEHRSTRELTQSSYLAVVAQTVADHVREIIGRILPNHTLHMTTSTRIFTRDRPVQEQGSHELFVEVGGQVTSVALLVGGTLTGVRTVPFGTNHVLHALAPDAVNAAEAWSKLALAEKQQSEATQGSVLVEHAAGAFSEWFAAVTDDVALLCRGVAPPASAVLQIARPWYASYAQVLAQPWMQQGIREKRALSVTPYYELPTGAQAKQGSDTLYTDKDLRLSALFHTVDACTGA